jgi:hypothetical protein
MFFKGSRYEHVSEYEIKDNKGRMIRYKGVRPIPTTKTQHIHQVRQGESLGLIAHAYFRDPERFWRICDANREMWPDDLVVQTGRRIRIPPPEG